MIVVHENKRLSISLIEGLINTVTELPPTYATMPDEACI